MAKAAQACIDAVRIQQHVIIDQEQHIAIGFFSQCIHVAGEVIRRPIGD